MKRRPIRKILIANRGEIAVRVIRTCKELDISTVAVFSDVDRRMPHALFADEAYRIGEPPARESYLIAERLIDVALKSGSDAIHPGYGFLSENAEFARKVRGAGLVFIGPSPESIEAMGDKTNARALVEKAGVPVVPGTKGAVRSEAEVAAFAQDVGFPILIKAAAGGGGKGMRVVHREQDLSSSFRGAQSEAASAFGDGRVYVEKYLEEPRHIEFQIVADQFGNTIHLGERECSIQRRHQKVVEESPSVFLDDAMRDRMGKTAIAAAKACNYENAGTIEFLVDKNRNFYFLEMNTRIQVEHPVTEMRTGIDLVALQIQIAQGAALPIGQDEVRWNGHSIECRIYAEDAGNNFLPSTGRIAHLRPPQGLGIREDRGIENGCEVSVFYDPMISKLVGWGNNRPEAIARMKRALRDYQILGVTTNIPLNLFVLEHPSFISGKYDTHFFATHFSLESLPALSREERMMASMVCTILAAREHDRSAIQTGFGNGQGFNNLSGNFPGALGKENGWKWKQQRTRNLR